MSAAPRGTATQERPGRPRLVTSTFVLAWLVIFAQYLTFYCLVTTMALYAVTQFAASDALSGLASSAFVVGATVARLITGPVVDRLGRRRVMLVALLLVVGACAMYFVAGSLTLLIAVRTFHGFAYAFVSTAAMAIAQAAIPAGRRGEGTGYLALATTLATAVGPALGLFLVGSFPYSALFAVAMAASGLGLGLGLFLHDRVPATADDGASAAPARLSVRDILHPDVVPIGIFMLLVGLCYAGVITYLNAYADQRDLVTGAGLFFVAYALAMLLMRFTLGTLQDRRGDNIVVHGGLLCFFLALVLLAVAVADWQVVVAGALTGLGYGTLMPAAQAIAVSAVPAHQVGTGLSTLLLLADVGIGLGPIALGALVSRTGYGAMYLVLAAGVIAAAIFYRLVHGRHQNARRRPALTA